MVISYVTCSIFVTVTISCFLAPADANVGYGVLGCWRDHPNTKSSYSSAIAVVSRYIDGEPKAPGDVLRAIIEVVWPSHDITQEAMYCFDEEIHGNILRGSRTTFSNILDGFRKDLNLALELAVRSPRDASLARTLEDIHINISYWQSTFLQVVEIELGSLYFREFTLLLYGVHGELINFHKGTSKMAELAKWRDVLSKGSYIFAKYSYWLLRYMPKKMADNVVFDSQKFPQNQLGLADQVNGKRLSYYEEALAKCSASDSVACNEYAMSFLKSVRITHRRKIEEYWKDMLHDFRRLLFRRHCTLPACQNDRYEELFIRIGEPVGLQYHASNMEAGKFCSSSFCSKMWLSSGGYRDFVYFRECLGESPIDITSNQCAEDVWNICTKRNGCNSDIVLTNDYFPLALRSANSKLCIDCSVANTWCKQGTCPLYVDGIGAGRNQDSCADAPENCKGPQFQIHNFERGVNDPLEILDEVHFTYASKKDSATSPNFLAGGIYSAAFFKTQFYMRLVDRLSFISKKTGRSSGPFICPTGKTWSMMNADERAACAQSSFTIFKKIDPASITSPPNLEKDVGPNNDQSDRTMQNIAGNTRELADDDAPLAPPRSSASRNRV